MFNKICACFLFALINTLVVMGLLMLVVFPPTILLLIPYGAGVLLIWGATIEAREWGFFLGALFLTIAGVLACIYVFHAEILSLLKTVSVS